VTVFAAYFLDRHFKKVLLPAALTMDIASGPLDSSGGGPMFGSGYGGTRVALAAKPHTFAGAVLSPKHARELTPALCLAITTALAEQSQHKAAVPYTLWITEAWRVLGWAEPSAALFWEMGTLYETLYAAQKSFAADFKEGAIIPPILSSGSTSSLGSGTTQERSLDKKRYSVAASAKELPVWLIGTFLLLHCEEVAYQRNLSGQDESRFTSRGFLESSALDSGKMDFTSLFRNPSLSPR
jgi:TBCC domain-containing protein 1